MKSGYVDKNIKNCFANLYFHSNNILNMVSIIRNANINAFHNIFMMMMQ